MSNTVEGTLPSQPTSAKTWKQKTTEGTLITVPSGNTALVQSPGIEIFTNQGIIPNALLPLVQGFMVSASKPEDISPEKLAELVGDPKKIQEMIQLADAIVVYCCLDPVVVPTPTDADGNLIPLRDSRRNSDILYVDEVDVNDKIFIMNFAVGGSANIEKFRN